MSMDEVTKKRLGISVSIVVFLILFVGMMWTSVDLKERERDIRDNNGCHNSQMGCYCRDKCGERGFVTYESWVYTEYTGCSCVNATTTLKIF